MQRDHPLLSAPTEDPDAPENFYQYWPIASPQRRQWLQRLVTGGEIYFRDRASLNDPNELRPQVVLQGDDATIKRYVRQVVKAHGDPFPPAKRLLQEQRFLHRLRKGLVPFEADLHAMLDRIGILSLSARSNVPLLWAHYAEGYRGLCIKFDAAAGLFLAAQPVRYTQETPVINRVVDDNEVVLQKSMFTKSSVWSYEREWRVIARWQEGEQVERYPALGALEPFYCSQHGPGYYRLPAGAIEAAIAGPRMDAATLEWTRELLKVSSPPIPLKQTRLLPDGGVQVLE